MATVEKTEHGFIKDPAFARALLDYAQGRMNPHEPVAMLFASVEENSPGHFIAGCETCYACWKELT